MGHVAPDGGIHINPHLAATIAAGVFLHETAHKLIRTGLRWLHVSLTPEGEEKLASATDLVTWLPFEAAERVIEKVRFEVTFTGRRTLGRAA
jgi:hypothetical protein